MFHITIIVIKFEPQCTQYDNLPREGITLDESGLTMSLMYKIYKL
jgi:hypothetical protein